MKSITLILLTSLLIYISCTNKSPHINSRNIHGFDVYIKIYGNPESGSVSNIISDAFSLIETNIDNLIGVSGEITKLNSVGELTNASESCLELLDNVLRMQSISGGAWSPFMSELNELWALESVSPKVPENTALKEAILRNQSSSISISNNDNIQIIGEGKLGIKLFTLGLAMDEATQLMIDSGISSGKIESRGITRYWGVNQIDDIWIAQVNKPNDGDGMYNIFPDVDGAIVNIDLFRDGFRLNDTLYHRNINPKTGIPPGRPFSVTIWADRSNLAVGFAEAALAMGEVEGRHWMAAMDETASFFVVEFEDSYAGNADVKMSSWISTAVE